MHQCTGLSPRTTCPFSMILPTERTILASVVEIHRQVGVVPVAEHAEADEVLALLVDLLVGVFAAGLAKLIGLDLDTDLADAFLDLVLDGQAVAIPAGHVGRVFTVQRARLDDHVLEDLVDRVADVDVAVGVGRAIVQHVALCAPCARRE